MHKCHLAAAAAIAVLLVQLPATDAAVVELAGNVHAAVVGVAAQFELKGRYRVELRQKRVVSFQLVIKEQRGIGHVTPGVENVVSKLKMFL